MAGPIRLAENMDVVVIGNVPSESLAVDHREMIGDRSEREARQESKPADDQDHADQQAERHREGSVKAVRRSLRWFAGPKRPIVC